MRVNQLYKFEIFLFKRTLGVCFGVEGRRGENLLALEASPKFDNFIRDAVKTRWTGMAAGIMLAPRTMIMMVHRGRAGSFGILVCT